jgi:hypothetical protein
VGGQHHAPAALPPVPIVQEAGWAPGLVWTCAKNLAPTGIRSPDRPARSQSLYRLSYPAHKHVPSVSKYVLLKIGRLSEVICSFNIVVNSFVDTKRRT